MINEASIAAVDQSKLNDHYFKPLYDSYCFSNIPHTIHHLLTGQGTPGLPADVLTGLPQRYNKVILIFVDAFGWRFFERYIDQIPFLQRIAQHGVVSKLTSQFPSTTLAHITALNTGLHVGASGMYEWFMYDPTVDEIIVPLLFSGIYDKDLNALQQRGITPQQIFPSTPTIYQHLAQHGVHSHLMQQRDILPSPFSEATAVGADWHPYRTTSHGLVQLTKTVLATPEPSFYYLYFGDIDSMMHVCGPNSAETDAEIRAFFSLLDELVWQPLAGKTSETLLILTADHGQIALDPVENLSLTPQFPMLESWSRLSRSGQPLLPSGAPRDMFLHLQPHYIEEAHAMLSTALVGEAEVYRTETLIEAGMFGEVSPRFLERIGNLVVLPYRRSIWYERNGQYMPRFAGSHGSATAEEIHTMFGAIAL